MQNISGGNESHIAQTNGGANYSFALGALTTLFFIWGFITSLNDILIPHLKSVFDLNYTRAMLIQFCFFGAYFIVSIPAGNLVSRIGYKRGLIIGLIVAGLGCLLFVPAASMRLYPLFLGALFILASGVTILQVSANPFVTVLGPAATASSRLTITQAFNALGTTVAPLFGAALILGATTGMSASSEAETVKLPYLLIALTLFVLAVVMARINLPTVHHDDPTIRPPGTPSVSLLHYRHLVLGAVCIFIYVGAEVSIGSLLISFIGDLDIGLSDQAAAHYVAYYWGGAMVGRFIGAWVMTRLDPGRCLAFNAACAGLLVVLALVGEGYFAMYTLLLVGLCNSIMFPTIFSLAVRQLGHDTSRGSGVVCAAIVGGALIPLAQGGLADRVGLHASFLLPVACYIYIVYYGMLGSKIRPLKEQAHE